LWSTRSKLRFSYRGGVPPQTPLGRFAPKSPRKETVALTILRINYFQTIVCAFLRTRFLSTD
jgi:hypothetical protein